jgi:hypothetical protein
LTTGPEVSIQLYSWKQSLADLVRDGQIHPKTVLIFLCSFRAIIIHSLSHSQIILWKNVAVTAMGSFQIGSAPFRLSFRFGSDFAIVVNNSPSYQQIAVLPQRQQLSILPPPSTDDDSQQTSITPTSTTKNSRKRRTTASAGDDDEQQITTTNQPSAKRPIVVQIMTPPPMAAPSPGKKRSQQEQNGGADQPTQKRKIKKKNGYQNNLN